MESRKQDDPKLQSDDDDVIVLPDVEESEQDRVIDLRDPPSPPRPQAVVELDAGDRKERTYLWLLVTVCVLNSIDAILTNHVISQGLAEEGNPIVSSIGLFPKLLLVPLAAEAVYLLKPKALWVPAVALFAVILYTAAGTLLVT